MLCFGCITTWFFRGKRKKIILIWFSPYFESKKKKSSKFPNSIMEIPKDPQIVYKPNMFHPLCSLSNVLTLVKTYYPALYLFVLMCIFYSSTSSTLRVSLVLLIHFPPLHSFPISKSYRIHFPNILKSVPCIATTISKLLSPSPVA